MKLPIEQKRVAVEQGPLDVLWPSGAVLAPGKLLLRLPGFLGAWRAVESRQVQLFYNLPVGCPGHDQLGDAAVGVRHRVPHRRAIDQVQRLLKAHLATSLAFAGRFALRPPEEIKEAAHPYLGVRELLRQIVLGYVLEDHAAS